MAPEVREELNKSIAMNLRSFRKDGTPVDTPVWVVKIDDECFASYTDDRSLKIKRLRNNPTVWIAACDVWARRSMPYYPATVRVVTEPEQRQRVFDLLRSKYRIHYMMSLWGSLLTNRVRHRVVLEYRVAAGTQPLSQTALKA